MRYVILIGLLSLLAACSSFKEKVGLVKEMPDEYVVLTNPPLSVPPSFNVYSPGEAINKKQQPKTTKDSKALSKGENAILQNMTK